MSDLLKQFHDQERMREEVFQFLNDTLDAMSIEMVRGNKDTTNLSTAYMALERAHNKLKKDFGLKVKKETPTRHI